MTFLEVIAAVVIAEVISHFIVCVVHALLDRDEPQIEVHTVSSSNTQAAEITKMIERIEAAAKESKPEADKNNKGKE